MKKAFILVNPYADSEADGYRTRRVKEELGKLGVSADAIPNRSRALIEGGEIFLRLENYDFGVCFDKDKYTPRMLEKKGVRLFNRAEAVELCDDKMLTAIALAGAGVPMPKTLPAPLCYREDAYDGEETKEIARLLGLPVVVKESYGSLGKQVYLAQTEEELASLRKRLMLTPHLYQEFIAESRGEDLRVVCIGGEAVAAMRRKNPHDFRSNLGCGGKGERAEIGEDVRALCKKVSDILGLDYCGIDLLFSDRGLLVCEVNSNAFFGGIEAATGVNVAKLFAEYMLGKL